MADALRASDIPRSIPDEHDRSKDESRSCFRALSPRQREEFRGIYLDYLCERNGSADLTLRTCANREAALSWIASRPVIVEEAHRLDQVTFARNQAMRVPEVGLSMQMLWALCAANINLAEAWGVDYTFQQRDHWDDEDPYAWVLLEESYHTRLLGDCVRALGLELKILPPCAVVRTLLKGTLRLPYKWSNMMILASEVIGLVAFKVLRRMADELFAYEADVLARIEAVFDQIITDEIGHVMWLQSTMDPVRLALTRRLIPWVARAYLHDIPVAAMLMGREELLESIDEAARTGLVGFDDGRVHPLQARIEARTRRRLSSDERLASGSSPSHLCRTCLRSGSWPPSPSPWSSWPTCWYRRG